MIHQFPCKEMRLTACLLTIALAGHALGADEGTGPDALKALVTEYAFREKATLNPDTEFKIEEYSIEGLKALGVQILLARYLSPKGSQFNESLFICHAGKLTPFAVTFGGHGLMSAAVSEGSMYYTYSWGSGEHRSHVGRLTVVNAKPVVAESGPLLGEDFFIKKDGAAIRLEKGTFEKFNGWKSGEKAGSVAGKETGFAVIDDTGKEIERFAGRPIEQKALKR